MTAAIETLTIQPATESYDLARLQNAIAERQRSADEARRVINGIEHALAELAPALGRLEILAAAGFVVKGRESGDYAGLQARLGTQRDTLAHWQAQIAELSARVDAIPLGPLDVVAGKLLGKRPDELSLEERGVRLVLPQGSKPAALTLFDGRTLEF